MTIYKVYEFHNFKVVSGASVHWHTKARGDRVPAIVLGELGRGRRLTFVEVDLITSLEEKPTATRRIQAAALQRMPRFPRLVERDAGATTSVEACLMVAKTPIGHRGYNYHTGEYVGMKEGLQAYAPCPAEDLACGEIAQGDAGRAGWGTQHLFLLPRDTLLRIEVYGLTYGDPKIWCFVFNGKNLQYVAVKNRDMPCPTLQDVLQSGREVPPPSLPRAEARR